LREFKDSITGLNGEREQPELPARQAAPHGDERDTI
jgi:hypothetical protein